MGPRSDPGARHAAIAALALACATGLPAGADAAGVGRMLVGVVEGDGVAQRGYEVSLYASSPRGVPSARLLGTACSEPDGSRDHGQCRGHAQRGPDGRQPGRSEDRRDRRRSSQLAALATHAATMSFTGAVGPDGAGNLMSAPSQISIDAQGFAWIDDNYFSRALVGPEK